MRKASAPRKLSPDVSRRLSNSRRESAALTLREIHCPFCSFLVEKVFSDAAGHKMVYCRKCKSEYPEARTHSAEHRLRFQAARYSMY